MQDSYRNPLTREDTLLGICQAIGDDFGFNPIYLRVALAVSLLWNPTAVFVTYLALGAAVLISRFVAPNPKRTTRAAAEAAPKADERTLVSADNSENEDDLAVAA